MPKIQKLAFSFCIQIIEAPRSLKRARSSKGSSTPRQQLQVIPARQRILSKLGLLHSGSLKHLIHIRPAGKTGKAAAPYSSRHHRSAAAKGHGNTQHHSPHQPVKQHALPNVPYSSRHQHSAAAKGLGNAQHRSPHHPVKQHALPRPALSHQLPDMKQHMSKQPTATPGLPQSQTSTAMVARLTTKQLSAGLIEDDIDWLGNNQARPSSDAVSNPEQAWIVQYLEAPGNAEAAACAIDSITVRSQQQRPATNQQRCPAQKSMSSHSMHDLAPDKHGTHALIEADIEWD